MNTKLRYNLSRGKNYMKWKLYNRNIVHYLDPNQATICMYDATLHNNQRLARKIHEGEHKAVCSWVSAKSFRVFDFLNEFDGGVELVYNPRVLPHWFVKGGTDNIDGSRFAVIYTQKNKVYGFGKMDN